MESLNFQKMIKNELKIIKKEKENFKKKIKNNNN